jgi:hypothetical protein
LFEVAPFPLGREALGAIRVRIWMNGMAAERVENPNPLGMKLGNRGFQVERMPKEEEKWVTNALFQERPPV